MIQAPDVSWNKSLKSIIQEKYEYWMSEGDHTFTKAGNMRHPSFVEVANWINLAWKTIPKRPIQQSMLQCAITTALDGSQDEEIECFKVGHPCHGGVDLLRQKMQQTDTALQHIEEVVADENDEDENEDMLISESDSD